MSPSAGRLDRLIVVLVEPQDPINVGNTVRAMKNMGLTRLRLVRPNNYDARGALISAPRAEDVVSGIEVFDTLIEALADTTMVVAMTARGRRARRIVERPRPAAAAIVEALSGGTVALMFGREDSGLPNEALDCAHRLVTIPTRPDYSSLNLGQAVMLMAYEIFMAHGDLPDLPAPSRRQAPVATAAQLSGLYNQIEDTLWRIDFFKSGVSEKIMRTVSGAFNRAVLDEREVRTFRGIFSEVIKYVERNTSRDAP